MFDPNVWYQTLVNWIIWFNQFGVAHVIVTLTLTWIILLALPDDWAGLKLFENKNAWVAPLILAVLSFIFLVIPIISWQLCVGIVITAILIGLTFWFKQ